MTDNKDDISQQEIQALRKKATSGARWTATATVIRVMTQFVQIAILARLLDVSDFGLFEMIMIAMVVGQAFGDAGVNNAIIHFQNATRKELSSLYWLNMLAGWVVFAVTWLVVPLVAELYSEPRLTDLLRYTAVVFVITPIGQQFQLLLERDLRFRRVAFYEVVAIVLGSAISISMAFLGYGVMSLVALIISQGTIKSLLLASYGWRSHRPMFRLHWSECKRFVSFGAYQMAERGLNILGQHLDKLLIGLLIGMEPLGYYGQAYRLIVRPYQVINPIFTRVAFPVFSRVQKDLKRLNSGFLELISVVSAIMFPVYGALMAFAEPVVLIQLSAKFESAIPLMQILSIVGVFYALGNPFGSILLARGRADISFYLNVVRVVGFTGGILIGAQYGVEGIAWALVVVVAGIMFPTGIWIRYRLLGMKPGIYFAAFLPFLLITIVVMGGARLLLELVPFPDPIVALAVLAPASGVAYLAILRIFQKQRLDKIFALVRS